MKTFSFSWQRRAPVKSGFKLGGVWLIFCWAMAAHAENFSHETHLKKASECSSCHTVKGNEVEYSRPGHDACKSCHKSHNFEAGDVSAGICKTCHGDSSTQVKVFPDRSRGIIALRVGGFSHDGHLNTGGAVAKKVGKITCGTCHSFDSIGQAQMPKHKECALCHSESNASVGMPIIGSKAANKDCNACHDDAKKDRTVRPGPRGTWDGLSQYAVDVDFDHARHQSSSNQVCDSCHDGVQKSRDTASERRHLPSMYSCKTCHDDDAKVSTSYQIENCIACHQNIRYDERPKTPYHYGTNDHKTGAKNSRLYCAYCHDQDPAKFKPQPKYDNACTSCHASEGVSPNLSRRGQEKAPGQLGVLTSKSGVSSSFATSFDLKRGRSFDIFTDAVDQNVPAIGPVETRDNAEQGGLAAARRPDEDDEFALRDVEIDTMDHPDRAELTNDPTKREACHARSAPADT